MIQGTLNGQTCWIVPYGPNTQDKVTLIPAIAADIQRGLTGAQTRRPQGLTLRHTLEWSAILQQADWAQLLNATQAAQDEWIIAPVWIFGIRVGVDAQPITAGLTIAWTDDWATWALNPPSLTGYTYAAPAIVGRFREVPRPSARTSAAVLVDFAIEEDSPVDYSFAPAAGTYTDTTYPTMSGFAAPIFPMVPEWSKQPMPGVASIAVDRQAVGPGREKLAIVYPQTPERSFEATFKCQSSQELAQLIAWWQNRAGAVDPHWILGSQHVGTLVGPISQGDTTLHFDSLSAIGANPTIALFDPSGAIELHRVNAVTSSTISLGDAIAREWSPYWTTVALAMLAVHSQQDLTIEAVRSGDTWLATVTLQWKEVAAEYTPASGETRGVTLGRLPAAAWFFEIDMDYAGALQSTYLTNWESGNITINGHTWTYNPCSFDKIVSSIDLEDDGCTFRVRWWAGCPWENWLPGNLAARGFLTIFRADVAPDGTFSNFRQVWTGEMTVPTMDGPDISVKVLGANAIFGQRMPRALMTPCCTSQIYRPRCGVSLAAYTFGATVVSVTGNVAVLGSFTGSLPSGFGAADWFAPMGYVQWAANGLPYRADILTNAAISGGQISMTLDRTLGAAVGASVSCVPGCDLLYDSGCAKFNNQPRHRGFPQIPAIAPSFVIPPQNVNQAKK